MKFNSVKIVKWSFDNLKKFIKYIIQKPAEFGTIVSTIIAIYALIISIQGLKNANWQFEKNSKSSDSLFNRQLFTNKALNDSLIFENRRIYKKNSHFGDSLFHVQIEANRSLNNSLIGEIRTLQRITDSLLSKNESLRKLYQNTLEYSVFAERPIIGISSCQITDNDTIFDKKLFKGVIKLNIKNSGRRTANNVNIRTLIFSNTFIHITDDLNNRTFFNLENEAMKQYSFPFSMSQSDLQDFYIIFEVTYSDDKFSEQKSKYETYHYFKPHGEKYDFNLCNKTDNQFIISIANKYLKMNNKELIRFETN